MLSKGQFLYKTIASGIIDNEKLQHNWMIPNEDSLVDEYVEEQLHAINNNVFDKIMEFYPDYEKAKEIFEELHLKVSGVEE